MGTKHMKRDGIFADDAWVIATVKDEEEPFIVRFRPATPSTQDIERFSTLILVNWAYESPPGHKGMPDTSTVKAMDEFEDLIVQKIEADPEWAACAAVTTTAGIREWRIYTPDAQQFLEGLNETLSGYGPYPLQIEALSDPDWVALVELQETSAANSEIN